MKYLLHLRQIAAGAFQAVGGAFAHAALGSDAIHIDIVGGGDARPFAVDILTGAAIFADLDYFVDLAHVERIEVDQLIQAVLSEDFFPKLDSRFQTCRHRERTGRG